MTNRSGPIRHTLTHTPFPPIHTHTHSVILSLSLSFSLFRHGAFSVYTALTSRERADYYSVAIKSQFGVGRLSGHLKGHSTRQIVSSIEMDGAVKVEPVSLVWKCACKNLGVATNLSHCPLQNIDAGTNVSLWGFEWQQWIRGCSPASEMYLSLFSCIYEDRNFPKWTKKKKQDESSTASLYFCVKACAC